MWQTKYKAEDVMDERGQKEFRSAVGKLLQVSYSSRPDPCFEGKALRMKYGKATKSDLKTAHRKI